ncbi:Formate acetyltransferase 2 [Propionispora sp. 2/2-37]|uniref:pyruvate formate lyase family protein n=1 Tax=Propionispora sp. 2/2-37 TaxID=1677858 RepID=UPI0006BB5FD9|nr:pyruvate formate lyase family protein [Propionispora sp. 2/2-37]CUH97362.1 Formate acetyltransferase 2 [Propionispora sp. 2/2-37]
MISQRVQQLKDGLFLNTGEISLERVRLYAKSRQRTVSDRSIIMRRAKAIANFLLQVEISIRPGELLAGSPTVKPRSGMFSPETDPYWAADELNTLKVKKARNINTFKLHQSAEGQEHIIMNYQQVLAHGLDALLLEYKLQHQNNPQNPFFYAVLFVLAATACHIQRYAELAEQMAASEQDSLRRNELMEMARISRKIAHDKPETFYEACQLFWFLNIIAQCESPATSVSPGRFDQYMYPFYVNDIVKGVPVESIKELLHCLWIKMNDVVLSPGEDSTKSFAGFPAGNTITLGGLDHHGRSAVNEFSYLILDTYREIQLPQPHLGIRINELTPQAFLGKTAEIVRLGIGIPRIVNDRAIIPGLLLQGVPLKEARDYAVAGCTRLSISCKA